MKNPKRGPQDHVTPLEAAAQSLKDSELRKAFKNAELAEIAGTTGLFMNTRSVYYLPRRDGRLETGLGEGLVSRGFAVAGRETIGGFRDLSFQEQIELVAQELTTGYWHRDAKVVANSFGAYLFLHAQTLLPAYIRKVLLLSPIVGKFSNGATLTSFIAPRSDRIMQLARDGQFPSLKCEIHVGEDDWQSNHASVTQLAELFGVGITVVPGPAHMLGRD